MERGNSFSMLYFFSRHKVAVIIIILIVVVGGYWYTNSSKAVDTAIQYTIAPVQRGMLIVSVSESGQAIVSNQLDLHPHVSGTILNINVQEGQKVGTGAVLATLDTRDVEKSVRDAELALQTAKLALQKLQKSPDAATVMQATDELNQAKRALSDLQKPADNTDVLQARDAVTQAQRDLDQAKSASDQQTQSSTQTLTSAYADGYNAVSSAFADLTPVMTDIQSFRRGDSDPVDHIAEYQSLLGVSNTSLNNFAIDYGTLSQLYSDALQKFQTSSRSSSQSELYQILNNTLGLAKIMAQTLQDAQLTLDAIARRGYSGEAIAPTIDSLTPKIRTDLTTINRDVASLQSAIGKIDSVDLSNPTDTQKNQNTIATAQEKLQERQAALNKLLAGPKATDIATAQERVKEKEAALQKLQSGPDALDVQNQELTIQQKANALADAKVHLDDYVISAPFNGLIGKITLHVGDAVTGSTLFTTLTADQLEGQITLNEVDIANVKLGNQVTVSFDALPALTLTGRIIQIDAVGTVSQGVVTYTAKIGFDAVNQELKPGMSLNATVITDSSQNVLLVPSAAVKSQGATHYVEVIDPATIATINDAGTIVTTTSVPTRQTVVLGKANDTQTEIVSGMQEGQQVVTQTTNPSASTTRSTSSTAGGLRIPGLTGGSGFGGGVRNSGGSASAAGP